MHLSKYYNPIIHDEFIKTFSSHWYIYMSKTFSSHWYIHMSEVFKKNQLSRFTKKSIRNEKQNSTFGNDYNVDLAWVLTD